MELLAKGTGRRGAMLLTLDLLHDQGGDLVGNRARHWGFSCYEGSLLSKSPVDGRVFHPEVQVFQILESKSISPILYGLTGRGLAR